MRSGSTCPAQPLRGNDAEKLRTTEILAIAFLAFGCLSGLGALIWKESSRAVSAPMPPREELQERVHQLKARLLERVPQSIERNFADY
jgi:hypothetical protein